MREVDAKVEICDGFCVVLAVCTALVVVTVIVTVFITIPVD